MLKRILIALVSVLTLGGITWLFLSSASTANAAPKSLTPGNATSITYACQNASGAFDYWEFRSPTPHNCFYSGESLQSVPTIVLGAGVSFPLDITLPGSTTADQLTCTVAELGNELGLSCK